jgi:hypothetical protein|tara:strand:- start:572 stop:946 length:375 start_codon:yes stop_codon:yes gene_type:complete
MAHYAQLDENNIVVRVSKVDDFYEMDDFGVTDEKLAIAHLKKWHGADTNWKKTSYNGNLRGQFAGIGCYYDGRIDKFIDPKPYPSWKYNEDKNIYEPPEPAPPSTDTYTWEWNEEFQQWDREDQ